MKKHRGMSAKTLFKLSFSGLFLHPMRLLLTVLLGVISFTLAGLAITAALYDEGRAATQSYVQFTKVFRLFGTDGALGQETLQEAKEEFGLPYGVLGVTDAVSVQRAAVGEGGDIRTWLAALDAYPQKDRVHLAREIAQVAYFTEETASACGISFVCGALPLAEDEVAIPSCLMHTFLAGGLGGEHLVRAEDLLGAQFPVSAGGGSIDVKICGIYDNAGCLANSSENANCIGTEMYTGAIFVDEALFEKLSPGIVVAWFVGDGDPATGQRIAEYLTSNADMVSSDVFISLTKYMNDVQNVCRWLGVAGGILAIFSVILLYQFVCISMERRRWEIGVLRALGGRSIDVVMIFMLENALLGLGIGGISAVLTAALLPALNVAFSALFSVGIALFTYAPLVFPLLIFSAVFVACLSALFPVLRESRRSPVEAIKFNEM